MYSAPIADLIRGTSSLHPTILAAGELWRRMAATGRSDEQRYRCWSPYAGRTDGG
jgi:hypothetical protein